MDVNKFRKAISERERILKECYDEWTFGIEQCWKQEVEILSENVSDTISFLQDECTAEEYSWISEIIDDLVEKTQSRELIHVYKSLMVKFTDECKKYNISESIEFAENMLETEVADEQNS